MAYASVAAWSHSHAHHGLWRVCQMRMWGGGVLNRILNMCVHLKVWSAGLWGREKSCLFTCSWRSRFHSLLSFWGRYCWLSLQKVSPVSPNFCCRAESSLFSRSDSNLSLLNEIHLSTWCHCSLKLDLFKLLWHYKDCKHYEAMTWFSLIVCNPCDLRPADQSLRSCASAEYLNWHERTCRCWPLVGKM